MSFKNLPPLKQWVIQNKYYIKSGTKQIKPTHYLLDGGIWKIPLNEYDTFLRLLSKDLRTGYKYYLSENKSEIFRFICDLDFYHSKVIEMEYLTNIVDIINTILLEYYPLENCKVIICGTESKNAGDGLIKTGFHLVWPKLWVSLSTAKSIREIIVNKLPENEHNWEDVVDKAIYDQNGLRMIGSRKMSKCKNCEGDYCEKCQGVGRIDEGRVYKPVKIMGNFNEDYFNSLINDFYVMLLETSIINFHDFPETKTIKELPVNNTKNNKDNLGNNASSSSSSSSSSKNTGNIIMFDKKIENFIKKNFDSSYKFSIKKINKLNDNLIIAEPTLNFCMNVNRTHSSSSTYFQIKRSGVSQKCFCNKVSTISGICCKNYCSKEIPLTKPLKSLLFPSNNKYSNFDLKNNNIIMNKSTNKLNTIKNCKSFLQQLEAELIN